MVTRVFQAIRIEVNDELEELHSICNSLLQMKRPLYVAIITFQPNEDRFLKRFIREHKLEQPSKKPFRLKYNECKGNPRAKSASLRIFKI